jgi:hypothetical protein
VGRGRIVCHKRGFRIPLAGVEYARFGIEVSFLVRPSSAWRIDIMTRPKRRMRSLSEQATRKYSWMNRSLSPRMGALYSSRLLVKM